MEEHHGVMHATETNDEQLRECIHDHLVIKTIITAEKQLIVVSCSDSLLAACEH
jgi:hypothetical protein